MRSGNLEGRICLVSPGHLGSNPRLVKEANALSEAGHEVVVIYGDTFAPARSRDEAVLRQADWTTISVPLRTSSLSYGWRLLRQKIARKLFGMGWRSGWIAKLAQHPLLPLLMRRAGETPARLYVGHCLTALPVVVEIARRRNAKAGFDAEDFHSGEQPEMGQGELDNEIAQVLEETYLGQCDYVIAASPLIAETYAIAYGVSPKVVLNVFPLEEAVEPCPAPKLPAFYWFSQTIGPNRGLEEFIGILNRLDRHCRLELRGHISASYEADLKKLAKGTKLGLETLPPDDPEKMVAHASRYTAGLSLERPVSRNRNICLTNKIFTYLLAGVPVILSQSRAQKALAPALGEAALLVDLDDAAGAAEILANWLDNQEAQANARKAARGLGRTSYNWDREKETFLKIVEACLEN